MTTTTESPGTTTAKVRRRRRRAMPVAVAGATGIAVLALFATAWPGADESTVASGQVRLVDQTVELPPNVVAALPSWVMPLLQQVDDSSVGSDDSIVSTDDSDLQQELLQQQQDQDEAQLSENNA